MSLFWQEFLFFIASAFGILVSLSASTLFFITVQAERQLRTVWRAVGFLGLAISFFLFILERKFAAFGLAALVVQAFGFIAIYLGVFAEPKLSQLSKVAAQAKKDRSESRGQLSLAPIPVFLIASAVIIIAWFYFGSFVASLLQLTATVFILATIPIQIKRYKKQSNDPEASRQNLYPLVGYIFLFLGAAALVFFRLPDLNIVTLRQLALEYSVAWQFGVVFYFIGFLFLGVWAWNFIKVRPFLRTYVTFLTIAIVVSSLGSLVFTTLIFRIVERNNLELMAQGAQTEDIVLSDRSNTALLVARTFANDDEVLGLLKENDLTRLNELAEQILINSEANVLRVYNQNGEIVASPSDERDVGRSFIEDDLVQNSLTNKVQVKSFATQKGLALSEDVVTRAIHPILDENKLIGAIEVGYIFDNAFVDFSKRKTGLDVTVFAGKTRSASTIHTLDGVSRWLGSEETDSDVIKNVINSGNSFRKQLNRLGVPYYSAFEPIRNVEGDIIGMISVGTPTAVLFEDTKQQLITTFLIITAISILVSLIGYAAVKSFSDSSARS